MDEVNTFIKNKQDEKNKNKYEKRYLERLDSIESKLTPDIINRLFNLVTKINGNNNAYLLCNKKIYNPNTDRGIYEIKEDSFVETIGKNNIFSFKNKHFTFNGSQFIDCNLPEEEVKIIPIINQEFLFAKYERMKMYRLYY
jgi:hypothetical protein